MQPADEPVSEAPLSSRCAAFATGTNPVLRADKSLVSLKLHHHDAFPAWMHMWEMMLKRLSSPEIPDICQMSQPQIVFHGVALTRP